MHVQAFSLLKNITGLSNEYASIRAAAFLGFRSVKLSRILLELLLNMPQKAISAKFKAPHAAKGSGLMCNKNTALPRLKSGYCLPGLLGSPLNRYFRFAPTGLSALPVYMHRINCSAINF
jgi:hypothetical protein